MRASIVYAAVLLSAWSTSAIPVAHPTNDVARSANADADFAELSALQAMMAQIEAQNVETAQIEGKGRRSTDTRRQNDEQQEIQTITNVEKANNDGIEAVELGARSANIRRDSLSPEEFAALRQILDREQQSAAGTIDNKIQ